ncbi:MAG: hypothetical protein IRY91_07900 [Gemmatimonadaceae bacterium]|nr:hypothetical protein [Gemmatimonadaceae bacterium]
MAEAPAQTRFAWPDTAVDVTQYRHPDQCVAAVTRLQRLIEFPPKRAVNPDTMPWDPEERLRPLPAPVVATAERCAARWSAATAPLTEFAPLVTLYLAANRDADAATLLTRRVAAVEPKRGEAERTAVIDSVVQIYLDAQPVRLAAAESLLTERARHKTDRIERLKIYAELMRQAANVLDTARLRRAAQQVVVIADSLTPAERESEAFSGLAQAVYGAWHFAVGERVLLDSLRQSTAAYVGLVRAMWAKVTGQRPDALELPIGEKAAPLSADFWFPQDSARGPRPTPGRVALVGFLDRIQCVDLPNDPTFASDAKRDERCWQWGVNLRRLAERFPELEITVASQTHGYFLYAPPLAPAEEAADIARWVAGHGIPGTLMVTSTPFWHLEAPDGRRIDKPDSNVTHYSFGKSWGAKGSLYLVDQDGVIVEATGIGLSGPDFDELSRKVDILLHRNAGGASRAAR